MTSACLTSRRSMMGAVCASAIVGAAPKFLFAAEADTRPALFLIGDSIIRNGTLDNGRNGQWGWGHMMPWFFDTSRIHVINDALGGASSRSFMESPDLWPKVKQMIRPGDFVMIGFGHNDTRSTLPGVGDEMEMRARPQGRPAATPAAVGATVPVSPPPEPQPAVPVRTFGWYLREYVRQSRELGATPIVLSLIPRHEWVDGKISTVFSDYALWAQQAAKLSGSLFIPLNGLGSERLNAIGEDRVVADLFPPNEKVHPNWTGAVVIASLVADGVKTLDAPLKSYLVASPKVPATPDIVAPALGFPGAGAMEPKTRTPTAM